MKLARYCFLILGGCVGGGGVSFGVVAPPPPVVTVTATTQVEPAPPPPVYAEADVAYEQPELVEVSPGIQVIYDYEQPVFFSDGLYWRQEGGVWYSSRVHTGGWARVSYPPERFRTIRTEAYVHYRPTNYTPRAQRPGYVRPGPTVRDHRPEAVHQEPVVRDHRTEPVRQEPVVRDHRPEPARQEPVVRDHRTEPVSAPPTPVVRDHRKK